MHAQALARWTTHRRLLWCVVTGVCILLIGPILIGHLYPPADRILDFFQEWSSARNAVEGLPVYTRVDVTAARYLGFRQDPEIPWHWDINVHPPTSVLLALPVQGLAYRDAFFVWNVCSLVALGVSLWLVVRALGVPMSAWDLLPGVVLLLFCNPLHQQLIQGQLNLILLLLIVLTWVADRSDRWLLAGIMLGMVTTIKLFPGLLFVYFVLHRKWKTVFVGGASIVALTGMTAAVLGPETYTEYVRDVLPEAVRWRSDWSNASVAAFWSKLFDPVTGPGQPTTIPLLRSSAMATAGTVVSAVLLLGALCWFARRPGSRAQSDLGFGLTVTAMLLLSPVTWDHYFLLLLVPVAVSWERVIALGSSRGLLLASCLILLIPPISVANVLRAVSGSAGPILVVLVLSLQCYALIGLFVAQCRLQALQRRADASPRPNEWTQSAPAEGDNVMTHLPPAVPV